jgi:hypothetical protein
LEVSDPLYPGERAPCTHWIEGWVYPRAGLDVVEKRKLLTLPGLELLILGHPVCSQSLYRLLDYIIIEILNTKFSLFTLPKSMGVLATTHQKRRERKRVNDNICTRHTALDAMRGLDEGSSIHTSYSSIFSLGG